MPDHPFNRYFNRWNDLPEEAREIFYTAASLILSHDVEGYAGSSNTFLDLLEFVHRCHSRGLINRREVLMLINESAKVIGPQPQDRIWRPGRSGRFRRIIIK
jgi:hypothetical protein